MKVALFSSTIDRTNGYGNITYELCMYYSQSSEIEFTLYLPQDHEQVDIDGIDIKYELPSYIFRFRNFKFIPYFLRNIDVSSYDIVHSLFAFPYAFMAERLARKYNKPFIMGAQGTFGVRPLTLWPEKIFLKKAYKTADKIIVPSQFTKDKIHYYSGEKYPIDVIHNGVNLEKFTQELDVSAILNRHNGKKILATVGGLKPRKGQDIVLRALPKILKKHPNTIYMIVGGGPWQKELEKIAEDLGVRSSVDFIGQVSGDEVTQYFKACDIYVHTPRVASLNFEGFGIVYIEASACKKAIVATDAGGIRDAIIDGKTGLIAADEDFEGVGDAVIKILSDDALREKFGNAGYEYAKEHDWNIIGKKYAEAYEEVLNNDEGQAQK